MDFLGLKNFLDEALMKSHALKSSENPCLPASLNYWSLNPFPRGSRGSATLLVGLLALFLVRVAWAQAPTLAWSTNVGARLFAVDGQTNVYANAGGSVLVLNGNGAVLQSNSICPVPGLARRDSAGNYYFSGSFDGTQDFGGITLVGGWINGVNFNPPRHAPGYPTCFVAKYGSNGSLQWVTNFGVVAQVNKLTDLELDPSGGVYAGYDASQNGLYVTHASSTGGVDWTWNQPGTMFDHYAIKLGGATVSNCFVLSVRAFLLGITSLDRNGTATAYGGYPPVSQRTQFYLHSEPVLDELARPFQVGKCIVPDGCTAQWLRLLGPGTEVWHTEVTPDAEGILARDSAGRLYLSGPNGMFAQYSGSGDLIWSNNFASPCVSMVIDSTGNRFVSFENGLVGRLQDDSTPQPPSIASGPVAQTVFAGDNASLTVSALGTAPLSYQWRFHQTNLPGATSSQLAFNPVAPSHAGLYSVVVSNSVSSVTSAPALLRVKSVQLYAGEQMLTNGNYVFGSPPTLTIRSALGGSNYYTLDGSAPTQSSTPYTGPFVLGHDAIVRAIGYNADQSQSEEAEVVNATVYSQHTLSVTISGGGNVSLSPPGGTYWNTNSVTATAVAAPGWSFLFWLDDASGSSPSVTLSMQVDRSIIAVFGTNSPAGDPPGLAWSTNVGARAFAVDEQTNVYAYVGGSVVLLNGNGAVLQTNQICPIPGMAKRDASGNYYFSGSFDGTQNFGGITLVGGWINNINFNPPRHAPGYPTLYVAKYASNGVLQWATNFGVVAQANKFTDLELDPGGGVYAGYTTIQNGHYVTHVSSTGGVDWTWNEPSTGFGNGLAIKLGAATPSNCFILSIRNFGSAIRSLDRLGNATAYGQNPPFLLNRTENYSDGEPVTDNLGRPYQVGRCLEPNGCTAQLLRLLAAGSDVWVREVTPAAEAILARDPAGNVYLAGPNGMLAEHSGSGDVVWSNNFASACNTMVVDPAANRFVSFDDGRVGRLEGLGTSGSGFSIMDAGSAAGLSLVSAPQLAWRIEASSNLTSWWVLGTVTNSGGRLDFKDPSVATARTRFYRAVPVP